jgi:hypothetical protein
MRSKVLGSVMNATMRISWCCRQPCIDLTVLWSGEVTWPSTYSRTFGTRGTR